MSPIGGERASVQNPMIRYAQEAGWEYLPADEPLRLRRGEGKALLHDVLVQQLQRLNPGIVDLVRAEQIIARLERMPPTIEGNLQVWEYLVLLPVALLQHPSCTMDLEPCTAGVSCGAQVANGRMPSGCHLADRGTAPVHPARLRRRRLFLVASSLVPNTC